MRASQYLEEEKKEKHISGGEVISSFGSLKKRAADLLAKGLMHSRGDPDFIQIQCELMTGEIEKVQPLPMKTFEVEDAKQGQEKAQKYLKELGLSEHVIERAYQLLLEEPERRGAIIVDMKTGERLDDRQEKGVRASRMDWFENSYERWSSFHNIPQNIRMKEALVLATKVCHHPATVAELCWSDDPDYVTGYVASNAFGYQRITKLKERGDSRGCRIFFVEGIKDIKEYIHYLEKQPLWLTWEVDDDTRLDREK